MYGPSDPRGVSLDRVHLSVSPVMPSRIRCTAALALLLAPPAVATPPAALYARLCAPCHGAEGRGDGPGAYLLVVPPRDFHAAQYRLVSTHERVPTDDDLLAAITRGLAGTPMPSWATLPEADRRALVGFVKAFADRPWPETTTVVPVPPEPADSRTNRARAEELYREACASCHGPAGHGDGRTDLVDDAGHPIRPRDFTLGGFKGDSSPAGLYRRIVVGMPGTPMAANDWAIGDDAWYLVRYVEVLAGRGEE